MQHLPFSKLDVVSRVSGTALRAVGKTLTHFGIFLQGRNAYVERVAKSFKVLPIHGSQLVNGINTYVAQGASVIGAVTLGDNSSIWHGVDLRGDMGSITIGESSNIQDNATVLSDKESPTKIGNFVTIQAGATLDGGVTIADGAMIGFRARIGHGCKIGRNAYIDAGAVLPPGTTVGEGQLWTGNPARYHRDVTEFEVIFLRNAATAASELALLHYNQSIKDPVTQFHERLEEHDAYLTRKPGVSRTGEEEEQITPADVIQHNQLAYADVGKMGMFRSQEYEEEAYYESYEKELLEDREAARKRDNYFMSLERTADYVQDLSITHPLRKDERDSLFAELDTQDPEALKRLKDIMKAAADAGDDTEKLKAVAETIRSWNPDRHPLFDAVHEVKHLARHQAALLEGSATSGGRKHME